MIGCFLFIVVINIIIRCLRHSRPTEGTVQILSAEQECDHLINGVLTRAADEWTMGAQKHGKGDGEKECVGSFREGVGSFGRAEAA